MSRRSTIPGTLDPHALALLAGKPAVPGNRRPHNLPEFFPECPSWQGKGSTLEPLGIDKKESHRRQKVASADILDLLDRARYDVERGWNAAALDALKRAVKALEGAV